MDSGTSSMAVAHSSYDKFMKKLKSKGKKNSINSWPDITYFSHDKKNQVYN